MESSLTLDLQGTKKWCKHIHNPGDRTHKKWGVMFEVRRSMAVISKTLTKEFIISI